MKKLKRKNKVRVVYAVACLDCGYVLELPANKVIRCPTCGNYTVVIGSLSLAVNVRRGLTINSRIKEIPYSSLESVSLPAF